MTHDLPRFVAECQRIVHEESAHRRRLAEQIEQAAEDGDCERVKKLAKELKDNA